MIVKKRQILEKLSVWKVNARFLCIEFCKGDTGTGKGRDTETTETGLRAAWRARPVLAAGPVAFSSRQGQDSQGAFPAGDFPQGLGGEPRLFLPGEELECAGAFAGHGHHGFLSGQESEVPGPLVHGVLYQGGGFQESPIHHGDGGQRIPSPVGDEEPTFPGAQADGGGIGIHLAGLCRGDRDGLEEFEVSLAVAPDHDGIGDFVDQIGHGVFLGEDQVAWSGAGRGDPRAPESLPSEGSVLFQGDGFQHPQSQVHQAQIPTIGGEGGAMEMRGVPLLDGFMGEHHSPVLQDALLQVELHPFSAAIAGGIHIPPGRPPGGRNPARA